MTEQELYSYLSKISGVDDFDVQFSGHSISFWGRYFIHRKLIRLYVLDENGKQYDDEILIREGLHELTHHIQYHHVPGWERVFGVMHDDSFYTMFKSFLDKAFNRKVPVVKQLENGGRLVASKKRRKK